MIIGHEEAKARSKYLCGNAQALANESIHLKLKI